MLFMKEDGITADDIDEIIVDPPTQMRMTLRPEGYEKIIEAQYSIPYCIAALLLDPTPRRPVVHRRTDARPRTAGSGQQGQAWPF